MGRDDFVVVVVVEICINGLKLVFKFVISTNFWNCERREKKTRKRNLNVRLTQSINE